MKRIFSAANLPEAHLLLHMLREANIEARVFNENAQGGLGELPFTHAYPEVWIERPEDEKEAMNLIRAFDTYSGQGLATICPSCGEQNPPAFEICWSCASILNPDKP